MAKNLSSYRVYASTLSSIENLPYANLEEEIHIVLAFARDYDASHKYTTGKFEAYFDKTKLNAEVISDIKNKSGSTSVKFFLSIGGRDPNFPFAVTRAEEVTWTKNATESLKGIVQTFGLDGLDVYYEHINPVSMSVFPKAVQKVIHNLKHANVIADASITVTAPLISAYHNLYKGNPKNFDYVVYQAHSETAVISDFDQLQASFRRLQPQFPKDKLLAGYSDVLPSDWATVPPPIFLGAVPKLLNHDNGGLLGISKWIVTLNDHNPENHP